jgi:hypothetical protein
MQSRLNERRLGRAALLVATVTLAACSTPPPTAELRSARDAIEQAQSFGAQEVAPQPMQMAQSKLARAQESVKNKDMDVAANLATEAEADANYAGALALQHNTAQTQQQLQQYQQQRAPTTQQMTQ